MSKMRNRVNNMEENSSSEENSEEKNENKENEQKEENVREEKTEEKPERTEEKKPEVKKAAGTRKEKTEGERIRVGRSHAIYVSVAVIFLVIGLAAGMNMNPTGQMVSTGGPSEGESDQFLFISPTGCNDCEELSEVAVDVAGKLGIPFLSTGYNNSQMEVPGYALIYGGNFLTTAAFDSEDTLLQQICQLTGNEAICDQIPEPEMQETPNAGVPKSDRPKVELFIWSYCPYGVQAQGPLSDVALLLGESADFEAVLYHDGHGDYETQQNKIQACIQEVAGDKYWEYAAGFVENIYPKCASERNVECDKTESIELMKSLGIDDSEVMSCVEDKGEDLIAEHLNRARGYGISGSPSLVINGLKVNVARNSESFKAAVCEAFNEVPEECGESLSSSTTASSGNC